MRSKALRILVIRIDFFGDLLCTTPLLAALKQSHPDCFLAVLASKYNRGAVAGNPNVNEVFEYVYSKQTERNSRPGMLNAVIQRIRLILSLRRKKFDYVIIPNGGMHKNSIQFARWLGANRVLFNNAETEFDDRRAEHRANRKIEHEVLSGFRVSKELVGEISPGPLYFMPPDKLVKKAKARLPDLKSPSVALHFSARVAERSWPYSRWCELAATLAKTHAVVILGSPDMWEYPSFRDAMAASGLNPDKSLEQNCPFPLTGGRLGWGLARRESSVSTPSLALPLQWGGDIGSNGLSGLNGTYITVMPVHLCTTADFVELAAALSICDSVICCDGGPVHIAAALKKPVVVLFENRPEKYKRWYPWAVPHQIVLSKNGVAVETIEVSDVVAAYENLCSMAPAPPVTAA